MNESLGIEKYDLISRDLDGEYLDIFSIFH